jgi:hypothetical protein
MTLEITETTGRHVAPLRPAGRHVAPHRPAGRHVAPLRHIIMILSQPVFALTP